LVARRRFKSSRRMSHVANRKGSVARQLLKRPDVAHVLAVAIQFPSTLHYTMVAYFAARQPICQDSLLGTSCMLLGKIAAQPAPRWP
jgi:hypothetical protein